MVRAPLVLSLVTNIMAASKLTNTLLHFDLFISSILTRVSVNDSVASSVRNELTNIIRQRFAATVQLQQALTLAPIPSLNQVRPTHQSIIRAMNGAPRDADNSMRNGQSDLLQLLGHRRQLQQSLMQNQEQVVAHGQQQQHQQQQDLLNSLRRELQQQEGRDYSSLMLNAFTDGGGSSMPSNTNDLRSMQQQLMYRRVLLDRFSTVPTVAPLDRRTNLSLQQLQFLSTLPASAPPRVDRASASNGRSIESNALAPSLATGWWRGTTSQNSSVLDPSLSQIPASLPAYLVRPSSDESRLSHRQRLLRLQLEVFEANHEDVTTHTRGRNKPISYGQVGIRCKHCAHVPVAQRQKGSTYFPSTKLGLYQAAQNMFTTHLQSEVCEYLPDSVKLQFHVIAGGSQGDASKPSSSNHGAGRPYWLESASQLGLVDTEDHGIRFVRNIPPDAVLVDESCWKNPAKRNVAAPAC